MASKLAISVTIDAIDKASGQLRATIEKIEAAKASAHAKETDRWAAIQKLNSSIGDGIEKIGALALGATAAVAGLAVASFEAVRSWGEGAEEVGHLAARLGMGEEAVQRWRNAAYLADIENEDFATSVLKLSKNLGEAEHKTGAFFSAFKGSPLLHQVQQAKGLEDQLMLMFRALARTSDANERNAMAAAMFGKSGGVMLQMLKDGLPALEEQIRSAGDYGLLTGEAIERAGELGDAWKKVRLSGQGLANSIGAELAPVLSGYLDSARAWINANREVIASKVVDFVERFWGALVKVGRWLDENKDAIGEKIGKGLDAAARATDWLAENMDSVTAAVKTLAVVWATSQIISGAESLHKTAVLISEAFGASATRASLIGSSMLGMTAAIAAWSLAYYQWKDAIGQMREFQAWLDDVKGTKGDVADYARRRVSESNARGAALQDQTSDVSSPLTELFAGSLVTSTSGKVQVDVKFHDLPAWAEASTQKEGAVDADLDVGLRMGPRGSGRR